MSKLLKSAYNNGKLMLFKVDGTGTAAVSGPDKTLVSLTDNGTGDYTLTFDPVLAEPPFAIVIPLTDDVNVSQQVAPTTSVLRFECRSAPVAEATAVLALNGIKFHSILSGVDGNDITIEITGGATAGSEVVTSTSAGAITIQVETTVSTATQVYAALINDESATVNWNAFMGAELVTGATTWATAGAANLAGGVAAVPAAAVDADFDVLVIGADLN